MFTKENPNPFEVLNLTKMRGVRILQGIYLMLIARDTTERVASGLPSIF
jgi:hypothetical protein